MPVLEKIAFFQNRRDEVPNQLLARELNDARDHAGIQEIAGNLWNKNHNVRSDCLKVLYEIGYLTPDLIAQFVGDFLKLLKDRNNRMVWGGMIALATIAAEKPGEIWEHIDDVIQVTEHGTLISMVWGVKTIAGVAAASPQYRARLLPILFNQLKTCIPRDLPLHAESVRGAVDAPNRAEYLSILEARLPEVKPSQSARIKKIIRGFNKP